MALLVTLPEATTMSFAAFDASFDLARARARVLDRTRAEVSKVQKVSKDAKWMIVNKTLYVDEGELHGNKRIYMAHLIASVLANTCTQLPDVAFDFFPFSGGTNVTDSPVLAIARKLPHQSGGILVANPYFQGIRWWQSKVESLLNASMASTWHQKDRRVLYRGRVKEDHRYQDGHRERFEAMSLTEQRPDLFDVKSTGHGFVKPTEYCQWRYNLNLPGSIQGSYSRNLNHLWTTGSVVLQWESEAGHGLPSRSGTIQA